MFSRPTAILDCRDSIKLKRPLPLQIATSRNQTKNLLNCKHVLTYMKKRMTQKTEANVMKSHFHIKAKVSPNQGTFSISLLFHRPVDQEELCPRCLRNYAQGSSSVP